MSNIGIFFGSTTGNTERVAQMISDLFDNAEIHNIAEASPEDFEKYDLLILGTSTWGVGDLQDDWEGFVGNLSKLNISGNKVAYFGTGDQKSYPDSFIDGIYIIHEQIQDKDIQHIGKWDSSGYSFQDSKALVDGMFLGLAIDIENQDELTEDRITKWVQQLKDEGHLS